MSSVTIRKFRVEDEPRIGEIIKYVISKGDTYVYAPDAQIMDVLREWCGSEKQTFVAVSDDEIVGTFFIKPNQTGLGSHIANAGYMVAPEARGRGIGRRMGEYSIEAAREMGFYAMQFNFVVKSNESAVRLWMSLGFEVVGEIPNAFRHSERGLTNVLIMYRKL